MKIISHINDDLKNITIQSSEVYEIISEAVSEGADDEKGGALHESLN